MLQRALGTRLKGGIRLETAECVRPQSMERPGGVVRPEQCCPAFAPRTKGLVYGEKCWFCCYADFHLRAPKTLESGNCLWPEAQID